MRGLYLWQNGGVIAHGNDGTALCAFYTLHDFYVEVVFGLEFSCIVSVAPFKQGERYERMVVAMEVFDAVKNKRGLTPPLAVNDNRAQIKTLSRRTRTLSALFRS